MWLQESQQKYTELVMKPPSTSTILGCHCIIEFLKVPIKVGHRRWTGLLWEARALIITLHNQYERMNQESSLAFWKKAAEQRIEAMKANKPKPSIKEIPATVMSINDWKLNPSSTHIFALPIFPPSFVPSLSSTLYASNWDSKSDPYEKLSCSSCSCPELHRKGRGRERLRRADTVAQNVLGMLTQNQLTIASSPTVPKVQWNISIDPKIFVDRFLEQIMFHFVALFDPKTQCFSWCIEAQLSRRYRQSVLDGTWIFVIDILCFLVNFLFSISN